MANGQQANKDVRDARSIDISSVIIRVVVAAIVLAITAFLTPNFTIAGVGPLILAAVILAVLDYLIGYIFGIDASPIGRGIVGFIAAAVIIYVTQYMVAGYSVSVMGAIIGAVVFGLADYLIPGRAM